VTNAIDLECDSRIRGDGEHEVVKWDWACHHPECHGDWKHDVIPWRARECDPESIGCNADQLTEYEYAAGLYGNLEHEAGQAGTCEGHPALSVDFGDEAQ
jgi:hypothetical protein